MHLRKVVISVVAVAICTSSARAVLTADRFQAIRLIEDVYDRSFQPDPNRKDGYYRTGGISNAGDLFGDAIWDQDPEHREHFEQPARWLRSTGYKPEIVNGGQEHLLHSCCGGKEEVSTVPGESYWGVHSGELRSQRHRGVTPGGIAIGDINVNGFWVYLYDIENDILTTLSKGKPTGTNAHGLVTAKWSSCCGSHGNGYYSKVLDLNAPENTDPEFEVAAWQPTFGIDDPFPFAINDQNIIVGNVGSIFLTDRRPMKMLPTGKNTWSDPIELEGLDNTAIEGGAIIAEATVKDISNNVDRPFGVGIAGSPQSHGIVWDIDAGTIVADFGPLTEGWQISGDGTKVAGIKREIAIPPREVPTVWSTDDGWATFTELDLNAALDPALALSGSDIWVELTDIDGVNDAGQVVGIGTALASDDSERQAVFLLDTLNLDAVLTGDVNDDGTVNNLDITPFIAALAAANQADFLSTFPQGNYTAADIDMNGSPDNLDITPFISLLTTADSTAVPEPASVMLLLPLIATGRLQRTFFRSHASALKM